MLTWKRLQSEQRAWSDRNFGTHSFLWPMWGVIEELGELTHARLKLEQGIRGTKEEHLDNQRDALADGIVFLADVCSRMNWDFGALARSETPEEFQKTFRAPEGKSPIRTMIYALAKIVCCLEDMDEHTKQAKERGSEPYAPHMAALADKAQGMVHLYLCGVSGYALEMGWSMQEFIEKTWYAVRERDWKKYPEKGLPPSAPVEPASPPQKLTLNLEEHVAAPDMATVLSKSQRKESVKVKRPEVDEVVHQPRKKDDDVT